MSDTIYQLIENVSQYNLPIASGKDLPKVEIDFENIYEGARFDKWGSAVGWEIATKAIRGVPQSEDHKKKRAESKSREIEIEGVLYKSGKDASEKLGYCPGAISAWAKKNGSRYGITIPKGSNQYTHGKSRS